MLKERLFREGLLEARCARGGVDACCGDRLALHLDHVNGNREDNTLENLRVLCPNCHSQTPTYCGRNKRRRRLHATGALSIDSIRAS
jgi:5-methylcytosine-specific restriction endonuclease McrA